jgi:hypothetical protein
VSFIPFERVAMSVRPKEQVREIASYLRDLVDTAAEGGGPGERAKDPARPPEAAPVASE